jgi:hypothetical protein
MQGRTQSIQEEKGETRKQICCVGLMNSGWYRV